MGCSTSKLDDEEAVQLCKDRKNFIKEAVEHRIRFASGHIAYIHAVNRVSAALRDYIEGDEPREFSLNSLKTTDFLSISPKSFQIKPINSKPVSNLKINYLRSGGNPSVSVEERPQSPETIRIEAYSPLRQYGNDGFFPVQSRPLNSSIFDYPPENRPNFPPPSPQNSQWDFFWNPFSSLDYYGYPTRNSLDRTSFDDDINGLRQVREEEGIPELEEETEQEEIEEKPKINSNFVEEVTVEDVDDEDDDDEEEDETDSGSEFECDLKKPIENQSLEVSESQNSGQVSNQETVGDRKANEEMPGFTVYVNRRPTSMDEVIKDLETQFKIICNSAKEVSSMLEASRAQYSSSNELTAAKMLNPVALIRSASSRSSSSRFLMNSSSSRDENYDSGSDFSDESCMLSGSHQSTLDRLYAWEKKLYEEVRAGERVRIAYEKKCAQLRNQDVRGTDPSTVDKTRAAIRDLHTQIKVSIHSVEAISKRIETLRDEELQPQLFELVKGLAKMWKVMADCHQSQKRTLDEAKLLLAGSVSKSKKYPFISGSGLEPQGLARSASTLELELRNWRACFESWIAAQRSYARALTGWLLRCLHQDRDNSRSPMSPRRSSGAHPIFGICIGWSRLLDGVRMGPVLDGLDFFAAGLGSLYGGRQMREESWRTSRGAVPESGGKVMVEMGRLEEGGEEEEMSAEKMAEVGIRVLCAGLSVTVSSLEEFAIGSADGYVGLVSQWENAKWQQISDQTGNA